MRLELTESVDLIKSVMADDDIWNKISVPEVSKEDFEPKASSNLLYLAVSVDTVIGLHLFVSKQDGVWYHPMLLKPYRKNFGREFFTKGLDWIFQNTATTSLQVEIPTSHKSTINLAKHLNFEPISSNKDTEILKLEGGLWAV